MLTFSNSSTKTYLVKNPLPAIWLAPNQHNWLSPKDHIPNIWTQTYMQLVSCQTMTLLNKQISRFWERSPGTPQSNSVGCDRHTIAIFFDLEKDYNTTLKHAILIFMTMIFKAICLPSLMGVCLIVCSWWELGPLCLIHMSRRWVFPRVASYL